MMLETLDDIWMHFLRASDASFALVVALCRCCHASFLPLLLLNVSVHSQQMQRAT